MRRIDSKGYVSVYVGGRKYTREHTLVMEHYLGRNLLPGEQIHHINGNKQDNRIENLLIVSHKEHKRLHRGDVGTYRCADCGLAKTYYYAKKDRANWFGDGKGNRLCNKCYMRRYHERQRSEKIRRKQTT